MNLDKYVDVILNRCILINERDSLFIHYDKVNLYLADKIMKKAKSLGIKDIYLDEVDHFNEKEIISKYSIDEIEKCEAFDSSIWDVYAKKRAAFVIIETEFPHLFDGVPSKKIAAASLKRRKTKPLYKSMALKNEIPWCIVCAPNSYWASDLFYDELDPLKKFWDVLGRVTLLDKDNPINEWNKVLKDTKNIEDKLNDLKIKKLYYKNAIGTNLEITLPKNVIWASGATNGLLLNFPTYEVFTTPNYKKTNGIVYSSKPLFYNGVIIDNFWLEFKNGKVVNYGGTKGIDNLKEILNGDKLSSYLGEVSLVSNSSPISKENIIFKTTLLDENASCHLALGAGFLECIEDGFNLSKEELDKRGINSSNLHVDFMMGTSDLLVEADTIKGHITIMKNGEFVI